MTIQEKRRAIENKIVGADKLQRVFNDNSNILLGGGVMGLFLIEEFYSTPTLIVSVLFLFSYLSKLLSNLFDKTKEDGLKEYKNITELERWSFNSN